MAQHAVTAPHDDDGHADAEGNVHAHVSSAGFYVGIFMTLIALTLLTVAVASVHLGPLNLAVAVIIASMKASLVVAFFMHLRWDNKFNALIFVSALMFIGVFFAYTFNDTEHRGEIDDAQGTTVLPSTGAVAPGGMQIKAESKTHEPVQSEVKSGDHGSPAAVGTPAAGGGDKDHVGSPVNPGDKPQQPTNPGEHH